MTSVLVNNRRNAWTRGGTAVDATTAVGVAKQAGLDWEVMTAPLQAYVTRDVNDYEFVTDYYDVPKRNAVIKLGKDNENSVIGIVGTKYKIVQNMEVFSALDVLVDSGDVRYTAAGEYNGGANVWMLMELPNGVYVSGDPHAAFLLACTSHDGSSAVVVKPVIERIFCANQITNLIAGKQRRNALTYTMKHTTNAELSVNDIRNITTLAYQGIQEYEDVALKLQQRAIDKQQAKEIFKSVWSLPSHIEDAPYQYLSQGERKQQTIALVARDKAFEIYNSSPTQENIRGTAFGAWQAVVEYADYYSRGTSDKRALDTITGKNDRIKNKALSILTA